MLLENKNAVTYRARGAIGGAVASAFARERAAVFLAGRTREPLEAGAANIMLAGKDKCRESVNGEDGWYGDG